MMLFRIPENSIESVCFIFFSSALGAILDSQYHALLTPDMHIAGSLKDELRHPAEY